MCNKIKNFNIKHLADVTNSINMQDFIKPPDGTIYHYTSPNGFKSIIENKKLRFTDCRYLNDFTEGKYALDLCYKNSDMLFEGYDDIKNAFKKAYENNDSEKVYPLNAFNVFQCSFSSNPDSLCLWNYYTKGDSIKGYNIGFDSTKCNGLNKAIDADFKKLDLKRTTYIGKVIYSKKEQLSIIKNIISEFSEFFVSEYQGYFPIIIHMIMDRINSIGVFFKPECFKIEEEIRIAFHFQNVDYTENNAKIKGIENVKLNFFERGGIFIPYFDVPFKTDIVKEIHFSPTLEMTETQNNIYRFLKIKDFQIDKSKIFKSDIPVRF